MSVCDERGSPIDLTPGRTRACHPWVVARCYQNGTLVYEQANGIFATSLNQIFTLGPTGYWTGGAADCTAYLQNWSTSKHTTLATLNFHVYA